MFSIGELSRRTGVKVSTIRYYEQSGLMEQPERSAGNQRRYSVAALERLSFIRHARALGLSIDDIGELVELAADPERPCGEAHAIASAHLSAVRARIAKLRKLERELKRIVGLSDAGYLGECSVIHSLADHRYCASEH
ncbi:MerR family transcriptional regulator [Notoacmeibacter marinus]|uniref:MerR family transcriptional regulator n=1 Tax=Notoacmeibacter marinus TaxID=1876515 RepID=UPI000DF3C591|nr:helix-turn-helix domain-containing protein [Notoacmeibacter marinus]